MTALRTLFRWPGWRVALIRICIAILLAHLAILATRIFFLGDFIVSRDGARLVWLSGGEFLFTAITPIVLLVVLLILCWRGKKFAYFAWVSVFLILIFAAGGIIGWFGDFSMTAVLSCGQDCHELTIGWSGGAFGLEKKEYGPPIANASFHHFEFSWLQIRDPAYPVRDRGLYAYRAPALNLGLDIYYVSEPPASIGETSLWTLIMPWWMPCAFLALLLGGTGVVRRSRIFERLRDEKARRVRNRIEMGLCMKCGYDLVASKTRCPECGTEKITFPLSKSKAV